MTGLHMTEGDWSVMAHGFVNLVYDRQTGPRGDDKTFSLEHADGDGQPAGRRRERSACAPCSRSIRRMGKSGYPLLLPDRRDAPTARPRWSTASIRTTSSWSSRPPTATASAGDGSVFVYVGLPGEPALGPPAFMHRFSGMRNPEAPISHHWLDSTHITFGVVTLGVEPRPVQARGLAVQRPRAGPVPLEHRDRAARLLVGAALAATRRPSWSMQVSYGDLKSPEQLEPDIRIRRTTASISLSPKTGADHWATTLAYGRNRKSGPGRTRPSPAGCWNRPTRSATRTRSSPAPSRSTTASCSRKDIRCTAKPSASASSRSATSTISPGPGRSPGASAAWSGSSTGPSRLDPSYGSSPRSYMMFLQSRL